MSGITEIKVPENSLLKVYDGAVGYADAFECQVDGSVAISDFVTAFLNSPVFRVERALLAILAFSVTTRKDVSGIADGSTDQFAVWKTEKRTETELLLSIEEKRIRTWFETDTSGAVTKLRFGSAILPKSGEAGGDSDIGFIFRALKKFHRVYSRVLLKSAVRKLLSEAG